MIPPRLILVTLAFALAGMASAEDRPNIIVYMVDDLGWNHLSAKQPTMGTCPKQYFTPNLEKLANGGLSFTHAYAQPNCAPTRAAMLSGQYPARVHNDVYVVGNLNRFGRGGVSKAKAKFAGPPQSEDVAPEAVTIAEAMRKNGYATAHLGKFHVGGHRGDETLPENVGFDINLGGFKQGHQPVCFASGKEKPEFKGLGRGDFDRFAAPYSEEYVEKRGLPRSLIGTPKHVSDALGDALEETIGKLAGGGKPFYLQFYTYAVHGPVKARPDLREAAAKRTPNKKMAEYCGFISGVDENLGRMLASLEDPNGDRDQADSILENTLILFTSDNGGTHTDNLPLRGKKGMLTEGGIRVPLIAYWKGVIQPNTVSDRMVHAVDYYPTCLDLAGGKWTPPSDEHPLDGESFAAALKQPAQTDKRGPVFFLFPGYLDNRAEPSVVTIADHAGKRYKLYYFYESNKRELYCLADDQGEKSNLASKKPEVVALLSRQTDAWLRKEHRTWKPKFPIDKKTGKPAGPPQL